MYGVHAVIRVVPGSEAEFEALARQLWAETHAREVGVRRYEYHRLVESGTYLVSMAFIDHDAFLVHQASPHHVELASAMRASIESLELSYSSSVGGASGLPDPAPEATGVETDPEVLADYARRYARPDAPWWD